MINDIEQFAQQSLGLTYYMSSLWMPREIKDGMDAPL